MKKYLLMALAAIMFAACGSDDPENTSKTDTKSVIETNDYSSLLGASVKTVLAKLGAEPTNKFDSYYIYANPTSALSQVSVIFNPETNVAYTVTETFNPGAVTLKEAKEYIAKSYKYISGNDENGYIYADNADIEEATKAVNLLISEDNEVMIAFMDKANTPEEEESTSYETESAISLIGSMMGASEDDIDDLYGQYIQGGWMYIDDEQELCSNIQFTYTDGIVSSLWLVLEDAEQEDVVAAFKELGYTVSGPSAEADEDGYYAYTFTKDNIVVSYTSGNARVTFATAE